MIDPIGRSVATRPPLRLSRLEIQVTIWYSLQVTGIPCAECVSYTVYLEHGNSKGEARGRCRHKRNSVVRNPEERNVDTKKKSPKEGLISDKDLATQLLEGCQPSYHRLD